jgi:hypothetical protein
MIKMNEYSQEKNANNKVDILYNYWLEMGFDDRIFFDRLPNEVDVTCIRQLLDE